jgi:hypothetical protein
MPRQCSDKFFLLFAIAIASSSFALSGCTKFTPPPPAPCANAQACASVITQTDNTCPNAFPNANSPYANTNFFSMFNNSQDKKIVVHYEERVRHLNSLRPDEHLDKYVQVDAGQSQPLGCQRTPGLNSEQYDDWTYTIQDACFVGSSGCVSNPLPKPTKQRDPKLTCEQLCQQNDNSCLKYSLSNSGPDAQLRAALIKFNVAMLSSNPPAKVDVSGLVSLSNLYTGSNKCTRGDLAIGATAKVDYPFSNSGSSCPIGFAINSLAVSQVEVTFPGDLEGVIVMQPLSPRTDLTLVPSDDAHSPLLNIVETATKASVFEPIVATKEASNGITFTGKTYYCAQVLWQGD